MIRIAEEIAVPSPPERVWAVVSDPSDVVSCVPGAELGQAHDDGSFDGVLVVKFSAIRVKFAARISLELTESELEGRLSARGRDGQGATRFNGHATFQVAEGADAGTSRVIVDGEVNLTGKLASLIESGAGVVVSRMTKEFSAQLVERCAEPDVPAVSPDVPPAPVVVAPAPRTGLAARLHAWWTRLTNRRRPAEQTKEAG
ncbi:SRPBCC family protein [Actinomadura sp. DC4]|uniref:SRPBCC family protein n=1 Tax=Actinomadura sp. DC4 TaxID=3055069 RepID=UPI0025AF6C8E|nr:SRPBCC family protein [Actinomadura sp. DC4]MDN3354110.1 SRPBCC family protein [Actinomadura sp. DC4]